jgi:membrane-associated protease RseP (regulator of RpoE activity)
MPTSPSSSIASPDPYATASAPVDSVDLAQAPPLAPVRWKLPALLFVLTVASILFTRSYVPGGPFRFAEGIQFAVSLLAILLTHEFGHYIFARHHRVNASLPHFIPLPVVTPFGTMGAVILMRDRIKSKNALLDIGASGPIAGILVAIPVILYGLLHSEVHPLLPSGAQEGQSILYWLMKRVTVGVIPEGSDVYMSPMAEAGWVGLFVTMLNLLPVGQLDGGHVAYALFGSRQNKYSRMFRYSLLLLVPVNLILRGPGLRAGFALHGDTFKEIVAAFFAVWSTAISAAMPWLGWFIILSVLERLSGGGHPPTEPGALSPVRRVVAIGTLVLFVLLFMPTPWMQY